MDAANAAHAQAVALPECQNGDYTNVWFQLELNCRRRFKKGPLPAPITVMALSNLPQEEHLGFYSSGPSVATAIVRTMEAPREACQKGVKPGATFWLCRPDGTKVTRIRADAKACLNMRLEAVGFLPDFQAPECNQVQLPPDQDEGPSYTLALKILGALPNRADQGAQRLLRPRQLTDSGKDTNKASRPNGAGTFRAGGPSDWAKSPSRKSTGTPYGRQAK